MAQRAPMLGVYLLADEHAKLTSDAKAAGFKSPALYLRALYREVLQTPEVVKRAVMTREVQDRMMNNAALLIAAYFQSLTPEELMNALSGKGEEAPDIKFIRPRLGD
jgi:hypothetical protein